MTQPVRIELLDKKHRKSEFDCGNPILTDYLQTKASQHGKRNLSRTYVATDDNEAVMGFYSLAAGKVDFEHWPESLKLPPRMGIPTILLGRLAVDIRFQGLGLGAFLLNHAMWRAESAARDIAAVALEVDAIDDAACRFYEHHGFRLLSDSPRHYFLTMEAIHQLGLDFADVTRS